MKLIKLKQFLDDEDFQWDIYDGWTSTDYFGEWVMCTDPESITCEEDLSKAHAWYKFDDIPEKHYRLALRASRELYPYIPCRTITLLRCIGDNEYADELQVLDGI